MLISSSTTFAQYASDAFRYSEVNQTGTARFQAVGGNHAALGGDASAISGNPAGLGFFTRSELSISPGFSNNSTDTKYIDRVTSAGKSSTNLANASLVITSQPGFQRKWKRTSLGISFSRQQSFQNRFNYAGLNKSSNFLDRAIEDANAVGWTDEDYNQELQDNQGTYRYLDHAYYQLQTIYPTKFVSTSEGYGPPYARDDDKNATLQQGFFNSKGVQSQWTIAYGGNYNDKLYVGGSVGFSRIRYNYTHMLHDSIINASYFHSTTNFQDFSSSGTGINATFGLIYKLNPFVQLGASLTSPTFTAIRETFNQSVAANYIRGSITNDQGVDIGPRESRISIVPNDFEYSILSPFKGSAGATYFINNKGFISGTVEFVGYSGMRLRTNFLTDQENEDFRTNNNSEVKDVYRNVVNARLGGEYRFGLLRGRLGIAYCADPYYERLDGIKRDRLLYSAGVGARFSRLFADLAGTYSVYKSTYTPYTLENPDKQYFTANISNKALNVVLTVGYNF
ncbi:OmpP1/FadL family transporter [Dyadobacter aurulentus]|uniref:OmpP1/FadL family transporter n=1 Tax=Dyadobacter sp. UC 10 TaxID=2605428 RepID=UPI001CEC1CCF|nr:outer membrane protein transport protein [Dyadobacter sp. UC 10]